MDADEFNRREVEAGNLTWPMIAELVRFWQAGHDLAADGRAGSMTQRSLMHVPLRKVLPLAALADGRQPVITSSFRSSNPSRPTHNGCDFFYRWLDSDPEMELGDGGAIKVGGKRRWWIPPGTVARAAAAGLVSQAGPTGTGHRCWVEHADGMRSGYFHLTDLLVRPGQVVAAGAPLGHIGDNPKDHDATHLHFEVSPIQTYAPVDPEPWLAGALAIPPP